MAISNRYKLMKREYSEYVLLGWETTQPKAISRAKAYAQEKGIDVKVIDKIPKGSVWFFPGVAFADKPKVHVAGRNANIFDAIEDGTEDEFEPVASKVSTPFRGGSRAKVEVLRRRLEDGEELWNDSDNRDRVHEDGREYEESDIRKLLEGC